MKFHVHLVWFVLALVLALGLAGPARAQTLIDLQRAVRAAQSTADAQAKAGARARAETLKAVDALGAKGNPAAMATVLSMAEQREQDAAIAALQGTAALRRARQALNEAVTDLAEQGAAIERAAARAEQGEVAPSVSDLLVCAGPDCVGVSAREHTAMILMGAVTPEFDHAKWPPPEAVSAITTLTYHPDAPPLAGLRREAAEAAARAQAAQRAVSETRAALQSDANPAAAGRYTAARTAAEAARLELIAADQRLAQTVRRFADAGRALKRAALLAGVGYALKSGGTRACRLEDCMAAEGLEAAAFLVIGAAEDPKGGQKRLGAFVAPAPDGRLVFR